MTSSTKSWMHDITCTLNDNVKEHIRANHMYTREQGKSCLLFGKWLKKPFLTQMLKRLIDLMRTGLFCKRNFHRQLVYMEEMELHVFFFDRDLRQFEPKNSYCISNNMNFHSLVLNLRRFLFSGKIQRFESINNYILLHFCQVKSEMRSNLTSRLSQRFMVAPATRRRSGKASESLLARTINNFV